MGGALRGLCMSLRISYSSTVPYAFYGLSSVHFRFSEGILVTHWQKTKLFASLYKVCVRKLLDLLQHMRLVRFFL